VTIKGDGQYMTAEQCAFDVLAWWLDLDGRMYPITMRGIERPSADNVYCLVNRDSKSVTGSDGTYYPNWAAFRAPLNASHDAAQAAAAPVAASTPRAEARGAAMLGNASINGGDDTPLGR
jgi:hypothetical protein